MNQDLGDGSNARARATEASSPDSGPFSSSNQQRALGVGLKAMAQQLNIFLPEFKAQLFYFIGPVSFSKVSLSTTKMIASIIVVIIQ